jgi:hypothetical protein
MKTHLDWSGYDTYGIGDAYSGIPARAGGIRLSEPLNYTQGNPVKKFDAQFWGVIASEAKQSISMSVSLFFKKTCARYRWIASLRSQ